jgi:hypothetical protein
MAQVQTTGLYNNGYSVTNNTDTASNEPSTIYNNGFAKRVLSKQDDIQKTAIKLINDAFGIDEQKIDYFIEKKIPITDPVLELKFEDGTKRYFRPCMIVKTSKMEDESTSKELIEKYSTRKYTGVLDDQMEKTIAKIYKEFPKVKELVGAYEPHIKITDGKDTYINLFASKLVRHCVAVAFGRNHA